MASPRPAVITVPVSVHKQVVLYLLEEFRSRGGTVSGATGSSAAENGTVDLQKLLEALKSGNPVDLGRVLESKSPRSGGSANGVSGRSGKGSAHGRSGQPASVTHSDAGFADEANLPRLSLPDLELGLDEAQLEELAFQLFVTTCGHGPHMAPLLHTVRTRLQISEGRARSIQAVAAASAACGPSFSDSLSMSSSASVAARNPASLAAQAAALQRLRPGDFESWNAFYSWKRNASQLLVKLLSGTASPSDRSREDAADRTRLARLRGCMRRLDVPDFSEYDETAYEEAADAMFDAAQSIADESRNGWAYPWGLRVRLCEILLRGIFNDGEPERYSDSHVQLVQHLQQAVWPLLDIQPDVADALLAWVHFRQFAITGDSALLAATEERVLQLLSHREAASAAAARRDIWESQTLDHEFNFGAAVAMAIQDWIVERLQDYHQNMGTDTDIMKGLVEVLATAVQALGDESEVQAVLCKCLQMSMSAAFERDVHMTLDTSTEDGGGRELAALAAAAGTLFRVETTLYVPALACHLPSAQLLAAVALHHMYHQRLSPWLKTAHRLDSASLDIFRAAQGLEALLKPHIMQFASDAAGTSTSVDANPWGAREEDFSWGLDKRMSGLLEKWCLDQVAVMHSWVDRLMHQENWKPVARDKGCARSALELASIINESLDAMFGFNLRLSAGTAQRLTDGIDAVVQKYVRGVVYHVGSADALIPPVPPLTRYKRELAVKAAREAETPGASPARKAASASNFALATLSINSATSSSTEREAASELEAQRIAGLSQSSLMVRLNSLAYMLDALAGHEASVQEWWQRVNSNAAPLLSDTSGPVSSERAARPAWLGGLFEGASKVLTEGLDVLCSFIGIKVIFWDMRAEWLEVLYRHRVGDSRLAPVLTLLDDTLGDLVQAAANGLQPSLARGLLAATTAALHRVFLDGGPQRLFIPDDASALEEDLEQVQTLFHADGDGLPRPEIVQLCGPISALLDVMALDTGILIANYEQTRMRQTPATPNPLQPAFDQDILLHILSHRADHAASKYLKKELHLPKKLESGGGLARNLSSLKSRFALAASKKSSR